MSSVAPEQCLTRAAEEAVAGPRPPADTATRLESRDWRDPELQHERMKRSEIGVYGVYDFDFRHPSEFSPRGIGVFVFLGVVRGFYSPRQSILPLPHSSRSGLSDIFRRNSTFVIIEFPSRGGERRPGL